MISAVCWKVVIVKVWLLTTQVIEEPGVVRFDPQLLWSAATSGIVGPSTGRVSSNFEPAGMSPAGVMLNV